MYRQTAEAIVALEGRDDVVVVIRRGAQVHYLYGGPGVYGVGIRDREGGRERERERERERTGYEPFDTHAPTHYSILGYVVMALEGRDDVVVVVCRGAQVLYLQRENLC